MAGKKILIATDVPYWRRSTGAEQRIAALVQFLLQQSFTVRTFFISELTADDHELIKSEQLDLVQGSSALPPRDKMRRLKWYGEATINRFTNWLQKKDPPDSGQTTKMRLADFRWPWAIEQFESCVNEFEPEFVLIEYLKLAYLVEQMERPKLKLMIDTHDALHVRDQQFRERGYPHWISISREEEAAALQPFDIIMAIQPFEADLFRELAPDARTIVVGHSLEHQIQKTIAPREPSNLLTVGYVGSANFSNSSAIASILTQHWHMTRKSGLAIQLLIAGSVCDWLSKEASEILDQFDNVELAGRVDHLADFYESVDLVVNPVEFGTGLKIKNCEALCYGVPLLTTRNGAFTMPKACQDLLLVVDSQAELVSEIIRVAENRSELLRIRDQLSKLARPIFSDEAAYSQLLETLRS